MADYSKSHQLMAARGVNLNAVGDTPINVPFARFQIVGVKFTNASRTLATSAATIGLYDAPAAGGTAYVTPAVITGLTTANKVAVGTLASTDVTTGTQIAGTPGQPSVYVRVAIVDGAAATCDVLVEFVRIP